MESARNDEVGKGDCGGKHHMMKTGGHRADEGDDWMPFALRDLNRLRIEGPTPGPVRVANVAIVPGWRVVMERAFVHLEAGRVEAMSLELRALLHPLSRETRGAAEALDLDDVVGVGDLHDADGYVGSAFELVNRYRSGRGTYQGQLLTQAAVLSKDPDVCQAIFQTFGFRLMHKGVNWRLNPELYPEYQAVTRKPSDALSLEEKALLGRIKGTAFAVLFQLLGKKFPVPPRISRIVAEVLPRGGYAQYADSVRNDLSRVEEEIREMIDKQVKDGRHWTLPYLWQWGYQLPPGEAADYAKAALRNGFFSVAMQFIQGDGTRHTMLEAVTYMVNSHATSEQLRNALKRKDARKWPVYRQVAKERDYMALGRLLLAFATSEINLTEAHLEEYLGIPYMYYVTNQGQENDRLCMLLAMQMLLPLGSYDSAPETLMEAIIDEGQLYAGLALCETYCGISDLLRIVSKEEGNSLLHIYAAMRDTPNKAPLKMLLGIGAQYQQRNNAGECPIHVAVRRHHKHTLQTFLDVYPNLHECMIATGDGDGEQLALLGWARKQGWKQGEEIIKNHTRRFEQSLMESPVLMLYYRAVAPEELVEFFQTGAGSPTNAGAAFGVAWGKVVKTAIREHNENTLRLMLDLVPRGIEVRPSLLCRAVYEYSLISAETLLSYEGFGAHLARNAPLAADPASTIDDNPLCMAVEYKAYAILNTFVDFMKRRRMGMDVLSKRGATPMHLAIQHDDVVSLYVLMRAGFANPYARDLQGRTVFDLARELGRTDLLRQLEAAFLSGTFPRDTPAEPLWNAARDERVVIEPPPPEEDDYPRRNNAFYLQYFRRPMDVEQ